MTRDSDGNPKGEDRNGLRAEHDSAGRKASPKSPNQDQTEPAEDVVERVAIAIQLSAAGLDSDQRQRMWIDCTESTKDNFRRHARAAIAVLTLPADAIRKAFGDGVTWERFGTEPLERAMANSIATLTPSTPVAGGEVGQVWHEGCPPKWIASEWFIAITKYRDRVVLTALPEEYSYDYKTADETYIKAENIVAWMQFPDSQFIPFEPTPTPDDVGKIVAANELRKSAKELRDNANGDCSAVMQAIKLETRADQIERGDWRDTPSDQSDGEIYSLASFGGDRAAKEAFVAELRAKYRHCDDCDFFTADPDLASCPDCKGSLA